MAMFSNCLIVLGKIGKENEIDSLHYFLFAISYALKCCFFKFPASHIISVVHLDLREINLIVT